MPAQRSDAHQLDTNVSDLRAHAARIAALVRVLRDPARPLDRERARRLTATRLGTSATG